MLRSLYRSKCATTITNTRSTFLAIVRTKNVHTMPPKRKIAFSSLEAPPTKRPTPGVASSQLSASRGNGTTTSDVPRYSDSRAAEEHGIIQREFYPREMSNGRCEQYNSGAIPRPMHALEKVLASTAEARSHVEVGSAVVHWFKRDLRLKDNRPLSLASQKAKENGVPLICLFVVSPQDYQAHLTSAVRVDFELRTLEIMKQDLVELGIPLHVEVGEKRKKIPDRIIELCQEWGAKHIFCGIEYEVDELRREADLLEKCLSTGISFTPLHDDVVVSPGSLISGSGKQYSVYSPWYRAWMAYIHSHPETLELHDIPSPNPEEARTRFKDIFEAGIPAAPSNKMLTEEERTRFKSMWPAGEHEAHDRLNKFLKERINRYKDTRNFPAANTTSILSVHYSTGTLSARTAVRLAMDKNTSKRLDAGTAGIVTWISEVAWRDFYKHVLAHWPYVCMHKPFKPEYTNIEWEYNKEHFDLWCQGRTGYPIVDAAMRQMKHMGWMHNRCRMIVGSFLAKHLMTDWRLGERFFMESLIDGDFASNNGGWGFSASSGVDPQPYFRIFNPLLQSEKFDAEGEYIRKWVPELAGIKGSAIHEPYARGASKEAAKAGYPKPMVVHKESRDRALERYKTGLKRDTA